MPMEFRLHRGILIRPMSAETRSFRDVQCMTALPPKAEVHP